MLARLESAAVLGVDAYPVHVEVDVGLGLPFFRMVGLPDASVRESRDRVRAAIRNSGFEFPVASHHHQPGAGGRAQGGLGVRSADRARHSRGRRRARSRASCERIVLVGELSLDGTIHAARGVLPIAAAARRNGAAALLLPAPNAAEAAVVGGLRLLPGADARRSGRRAQPAARSTGPTSRDRRPPATADARRASRRSTCATCAGRRSRGARSRSPRRAATTC